MSGIKEKLSRMKRSGSTGANNSVQEGSLDLPQEVDDTPSITASSDPRWDKIGVYERTHSQGSFLIRERRYEMEQAHGDHRLGELRNRTELFSAMTNGAEPEAESQAPIRLDTLLFLDTETTGLGVGAGNVPFMIGLGFYEPDAFVVQQLFIRNPAEERAMLAYLQDTMETRNRLVTYNGKCFDWPIVKNRFVLNRLRSNGAEPQHFDLLYPSRSLWRRSLPSCRLSIVEKARLGLTRIDDVPGSMAPELYFLYLAEGNPAVLSGVFEHNEKDVLTLAALSVHLAKLLEGTIPLALLDEEELYRLALWLDKLGEESKAREAIDSLVSRSVVAKTQYALLCAAFYKRRHRYDLAVPIWRDVISAPGRSGLSTLEPLLELAMFYEHRERDITEALHMAEQALNRAWNRLSLSRGDEKQRAVCEQLQQRITRLRKKASGDRQKPKPPATPPVEAGIHSAVKPRRSQKQRPAVYENTLFSVPNG